MGMTGGISSYGYVNSNPFNYADPLGLCGDCEDMMPPKPPGNNLSADIYTMQGLRQFTIINGGTAMGREYLIFYENERLHGPWDFKQQGRQYADYGSFHYGAVDAAAGIPDTVLLRAAVWAQTRSGNGNPAFGSPFGGAP